VDIAREATIAHLPREAQEIMRYLFAEVDKVDRSLGLAPPLPTDGTALSGAWERRPPRDGVELDERRRDRAFCVEPIQKQMLHILAMFPVPQPILVARLPEQFLAALPPSHNDKSPASH
jgi:hypothetical protein